MSRSCQFCGKVGVFRLSNDLHRIKQDGNNLLVYAQPSSDRINPTPLDPKTILDQVIYFKEFEELLTMCDRDLELT